MKSLFSIFLLTILICFSQAALGQDFGQLLQAVDKLELSLRQMVESEQGKREKAIDDLAADLKLLQIEFNSLKSQPQGSADASSNNQELAGLKSGMNQLAKEYLVLRNKQEEQAGIIAELQTQVASGATASGQGVSPYYTQQLASLSMQIIDLKSELNKYRAEKSHDIATPGPVKVNPPAHKLSSKPSGAKTTVSGSLYSHGMADFSEDSENYNEFALSRAYVTLKSKLSDFASIKITSDLKLTDDKYNIILKYAYLDWKPGFTHGYAKLRFGLQATQYIDQMNKLWGRRYLEKTVGDKHKYLTSSDLGISTIVSFGPKAKFGFASLAILNGTSYSSVQEHNSHKDFNLVSLVKPLKNLPAFSKSTLMMQFYTGTQNEELNDIVTVDSSGAIWDTTVTTVGASDWKRQIYSIGGLLAWNSTLDFGFDMNFTVVGKGADTDAVRKRGLSFFSAFYLKKLFAKSSFMSSLNLFGRVDTYDPNTNKLNDGETLSIFGIESVPVKSLRVALNYRFTNYDDNAHKSKSMLYINTLFKF